MSEAAPRGASGRVAWRDHDHTQGSLYRSLAILAAPLLVTSLTQASFQLADLALISRLGEDATTAVIVTNQSIRQVLFMLVMGASFGAQALVAHAIGSGDTERAEHVAGQVFVLGGGISLSIAALALFVPESFLRFMNVSPEVLGIGVPYVRAMLVLAFGFVLGMLFQGILNGAGDTTTPMWISIVTTVVSLLAEAVLIFGWGPFPELGITGVAVGLAVGQSLGIALSSAVLLRGGSRVHLRLHHLRPDFAWLGRIAALSWKPALQMVGGFLVTFWFIRLIGNFGPQPQAAYSIGMRLGMVAPMLAFPLAGAAATLVGQNLGAGNVPRAWRAVWVGLSVHAPLMWAIAGAIFWFREPLVSAFAQDPEVIRIGSEWLGYQAGQFVCFGLSFVFFRVLQGAGDMTVPMVLSLGVSLLLSIPLGTWMASDWGLAMGPTGVFVSSLITAIVTVLLNGGYFATGRWARRARHLG